MMALAKLAQCLDKAVKQKAMSSADAADILRRAERKAKEYQDYMALSDAERAAVDAATAEALAAAATARRQTALQIVRVQEVQAALSVHPDGVTAAAMGILSRDITGKTKGVSIEYRAESIARAAFAEMNDLIKAYRHKFLGFGQDKPGLRAMVRELFGENTGDGVASAAAKAWGDVAENLRQRFNRAGGDIGKLDTWRLPQSHNADRVKKAGFDAWAARFDDADRALMMQAHDLDAAGLDTALRSVYETISTDGLSKVTVGPGGMVSGQGKKLAGTHTDHRFLHFASADSWMAYHDAFGAGNVFDAMVGHVRMMARDIALMEKLGPNPDATAGMMRMLAEKAGDRAPWRIERVYDQVSGKASVPENRLLARIGSGTRNLLTAAQLGSAVISGLSDLSFLDMAARWNGLKSARMFAHYAKGMNPANGEHRALARRLGLVTDTYLGMSRMGQRYGDEMNTAGFTRWVANSVLEISGLAAHTDAGRNAFRLEMLGSFADFARNEWGALPERLRAALERGGLDAVAWDKARQFKLLDVDGATFMDPIMMMKSADADTVRAGQALHELILQETAYAMPEPDARVRAMTTGGSRPGTIPGEIMRSLMQYKSFGVSVMMTNLGRAMHQGSVGSSLATTGALVVSATLTGSLALQLKQIATGKDARAPDNAEFWAEAFFQGGGFGIYGDFVRSAFARNQGDLAKTLAGPTMGLLSDLVRLSSYQARRGFDGHDTKFSAELVKFVQRYMPGTSLWYSKLALDRMVFSQLRLAADPRAALQLQRMERDAQKEYGQGFWWRPGQTAPDRAPRLF